MSDIDITSVRNKDPEVITHNLPGSEPATAANYGVFYTAHFPCEVAEFSTCWETASSSGTLQLERLTGTTAPGSGDLILSSVISTAGAANTMVYGTLAVGTVRQLERGNRLAIRDGGTLTSSVGLSTTTLLFPLGKGHYLAHGTATRI